MNNANTISPRILIYQEDDSQILVDYLVHNGFQVINSNDNSVFNKIIEKDYDICIFDHYKTEEDNYELKPLKLLRKLVNKTPVIILSDKFKHEYIINAFNEGADDYIVKPYNIEELICRIRAVLKRCGVSVRNIETSYKIGDYTFNIANRTLTIGNVDTQLSVKQSKILALLCAYKNELLPKKLILQQIWNDDNYFTKRSLDVYMHALRNMLKMDSRISIETTRGSGYSLVIANDESLA